MCCKILDKVDTVSPVVLTHDNASVMNALVDKIYECGDVVCAFWEAREWHHATVIDVNNNGTYNVKYNDGVIEKCVVCDHVQPVPSKWSGDRISRFCEMLGIDLRVKNSLRKRKLAIKKVWDKKQHDLKTRVFKT